MGVRRLTRTIGELEDEAKRLRYAVFWLYSIAKSHEGENDRLKERLPCGHPVQAQRTAGSTLGISHWCSWCEDLAQWEDSAKLAWDAHNRLLADKGGLIRSSRLMMYLLEQWASVDISADIPVPQRKKLISLRVKSLSAIEEASRLVSRG